MIFKLAQLKSLGAYFDTDMQTLSGLSNKEFIIAFHEMACLFITELSNSDVPN